MDRHDTRTGIDAELQALAGRLQEIISEHRSHDVLPGFPLEAKLLTERVVEEDAAYVYHRISCMLSEAGIIPGQDEGEQCQSGD